MRVAVASWTARHAGGIESYLAAVMPAMCRAGLDVSFFHEVDAPAQRARIDIGTSVPVFSVASAGVERAIEQLSAWRPDVVYLHGLHNVNTAHRLLDVAPSVTFVHTYIGTCISGTKTHIRPRPVACSRLFGPACLALYFPCGCGGSNPVTMVRLYRSQRQRQHTLSAQAAVITHSEHMKNELARHGITASVVAFPVSGPGSGEVVPAPKAIDILFAGRMDRVKGGTLLIDALPQIRRELNRPLRVQFSGDGPDRQRWESSARQVQDTDSQISITFSGWSDEAQVNADMNASRLLVVPSVWPEPLGSVGIAAARFGVPAAAFAVGGIPQWLHDGVSGHLAPADPPTAGGLAGAVCRCLRDPRHYDELSRGARADRGAIHDGAPSSRIDRASSRGWCMVGADQEWVAALLRASVFDGPVLELGTGYGGATCRAVVEAAGLRYVGTDVERGPGVDIPANFERAEDMAALTAAGPFGAVLILNVLEHTFEPIRVLDNARTLLKPGGALVVLTPAVWPLHSYPIDTWRILPGFLSGVCEAQGHAACCASDSTSWASVPSTRSAMQAERPRSLLRRARRGRC